MTTEVRPLDNRVLVKPADRISKSAGGIIIPDTVQDRPQKGTVIAVGEGKRSADGSRLPVSVKIGDVVIFGKFTGNEIKVDGESHLLMFDEEVMCVVQEGDAVAEEDAA